MTDAITYPPQVYICSRIKSGRGWLETESRLSPVLSFEERKAQAAFRIAELNNRYGDGSHWMEVRTV